MEPVERDRTEEELRESGGRDAWSRIGEIERDTGVLRGRGERRASWVGLEGGYEEIGVEGEWENKAYWEGVWKGGKR